MNTLPEKPALPAPPLTVGDILDALAKYPRDMRVLTDDGDGWYYEVAGVSGPAQAEDGGWWSEENEYALPTLIAGTSWDSRSL